MLDLSVAQQIALACVLIVSVPPAIVYGIQHYLDERDRRLGVRSHG